MKAYNHLCDYLHRWTIFTAGKLHIRLHHILSADGTPFLHSHPFWYVSIIYRGGYTEQVLLNNVLTVVTHVAPTIIIRRPTTFHRISNVTGTCKTLFFTWKANDWNLLRHSEITTPDTYVVPNNQGVYRRIINDRSVYSKFENGVWWVGMVAREGAQLSDTLSVHQCCKWEPDNE